MSFAALAFAAGVVLLQQQAVLPPLSWAWALPALFLLAVWKRPFVLPLAFAAGFFWAGYAAHERMAEWLSPELEGRDLEIIGVVSGLPSRTERGLRFELEPEPAPTVLPRKLLVSWYAEGENEPEPEVHPGERWHLTVRLRRPHGQVNPHGFDYEAWLLAHGVGATGYVRARGTREKLGERERLLDRIGRAREAVRARFEAVLGATPAAGILSALAVGDQRAISAEEWRLFSRTGVTHLMSISGLHVTLVSGLAAWLVAFGWRRVPALALRLPARKAAAAAAILAALGYTLLAGFAVPAQRTFFMVSFVSAALWAGRLAAPERTLALALASVVVLDPFAPLSAGFWLSFGAVALIFYVASGWTAREPRVLQWARIQWAITLGLAPAVLLLFRELPLAGPLANALAIPLVSVVITPLALLAALAPVPVLLDLAAWLVQGLLQFLEWCAALPGAQWQQPAPATWTIAIALAGVAWLLAPRGIPGRVCGIALIVPAFAVAPPAPAHGTAWITAFDVGQGLAIRVRTASRTLLYDAGPAFGAEADSGGRIIVPALRGEGAAAIDLMVLTHEDADHIGGALSVLETLDVQALATSLAAPHSLHVLAPQARLCAAGMQWNWDGVHFEFLHPRPSALPKKRNDRSCVLRIATAGGSMLLPGDIERSGETALLASGPGRLKADVLLVPHHGSRSSSSQELIDAVSPRWAVVAAGYRNRFAHPNAEVLSRYAAAGVGVLRTDRDGAIHIVLGRTGVEKSTERQRSPRYWRAAGGV